MNEPQLPLPETLIVYHQPCDHMAYQRCDEPVHEHIHIDGYCSAAQAPGPLPDHEVRYGDWTETNCMWCHLTYRVAALGETIVPAHHPAGRSAEGGGS